MKLKEGFLPEDSFMQEGDISLNQRKLYAQSLKQTGNNVQLFDTNKSEAQNEKEIEELNMHLMQIAKSSLDDPPADRTVAVIKPGSQQEADREEWLAQQRKHRVKMLAQKSSMDDPIEDRTVTVVAPNSVKEEGLVIWLVQNKRISAKQANFIQMDDDLANEFSIYAQDDDE